MTSSYSFRGQDFRNWFIVFVGRFGTLPQRKARLDVVGATVGRASRRLKLNEPRHILWLESSEQWAFSKAFPLFPDGWLPPWHSRPHCASSDSLFHNVAISCFLRRKYCGRTTLQRRRHRRHESAALARTQDTYATRRLRWSRNRNATLATLVSI